MERGKKWEPKEDLQVLSGESGNAPYKPSPMASTKEYLVHSQPAWLIPYLSHQRENKPPHLRHIQARGPEHMLQGGVGREHLQAILRGLVRTLFPKRISGCLSKFGSGWFAGGSLSLRHPELVKACFQPGGNSSASERLCIARGAMTRVRP